MEFFLVCIQSKYGKIRARKNSVFGNFWRSVYINGLEEGWAQLPEILTSTYGMKLKLELRKAFIKGDDRIDDVASYIICGPENFLS